ncbi:hypothetical protein EIP91_002314 [Steccherinum ochraceum]|uniref:Uncharacterized protein n=1 Tax=Steccherinum ochraceum TaxID=92696 RepID=A0A4V2MWC6_9APHY|nr:hypothetical protein EIP91_002314 [Steccherinum ochraceum]
MLLLPSRVYYEYVKYIGEELVGPLKGLHTCLVAVRDLFIVVFRLTGLTRNSNVPEPGAQAMASPEILATNPSAGDAVQFLAVTAAERSPSSYE